MEYIVIILTGALLIGTLLVPGLYFLWGYGIALFVAKFIAGPVGLAASFILFLVCGHACLARTATAWLTAAGSDTSAIRQG